ILAVRVEVVAVGVGDGAGDGGLVGGDAGVRAVHEVDDDPTGGAGCALVDVALGRVGPPDVAERGHADPVGGVVHGDRCPGDGLGVARAGDLVGAFEVGGEPVWGR